MCCMFLVKCVFYYFNSSIMYHMTNIWCKICDSRVALFIILWFFMPICVVIILIISTLCSYIFDILIYLKCIIALLYRLLSMMKMATSRKLRNAHNFDILWLLCILFRFFMECSKYILESKLDSLEMYAL
jgi:hypothetical protein